jgi:sulfopyruvate decarboxylase TPP-binding subunit
MFTGSQVASLALDLGITHVVTLPDTTIGIWADVMEDTTGLSVVRVCREGEAWGVAGGLFLGGAKPLVLIQCTGLFESGDALRNIVHDWHLPILAMVGYRSYLDQSVLPGDTCLTFTEPILHAWKLPHRLIVEPAQLPVIETFFRESIKFSRPGVVLIAEGRA